MLQYCPKLEFKKIVIPLLPDLVQNSHFRECRLAQGGMVQVYLGAVEQFIVLFCFLKGLCHFQPSTKYEDDSSSDILREL